MIVGAGHRHHLAQAHGRAHVFRHAAILRRIIDGARGDDRALPRHQSRDGTHGPDRARIRQRNRHALKIGDGQLIAARPRHQVVIGRDEFREIHGFGALDARNFQRPRAVLAGDVHGDSQVDVPARHAERFLAALRIRLVHRRNRLDRAHDGPRHQMRVRKLALPCGRAMLIDQPPVLVDHLHRHHALAGGDGNRQAGRHILGDAQRRAAQRDQLIAFGERDGRRFRSSDGERPRLVGRGSATAVAFPAGAAVCPLPSKTEVQVASTAFRSCLYS